jgi:hypothetical protein
MFKSVLKPLLLASMVALAPSMFANSASVSVSEEKAIGVDEDGQQIYARYINVDVIQNENNTIWQGSTKTGSSESVTSTEVSYIKPGYRPAGGCDLYPGSCSGSRPFLVNDGVLQKGAKNVSLKFTKASNYSAAATNVFFPVEIDRGEEYSVRAEKGRRCFNFISGWMGVMFGGIDDNYWGDSTYQTDTTWDNYWRGGIDDEFGDTYRQQRQDYVSNIIYGVPASMVYTSGDSYKLLKYDEPCYFEDKEVCREERYCKRKIFGKCIDIKKYYRTVCDMQEGVKICPNDNDWQPGKGMSRMVNAGKKCMDKMMGFFMGFTVFNNDRLEELRTIEQDTVTSILTLANERMSRKKVGGWQIKNGAAWPMNMMKGMLNSFMGFFKDPHTVRTPQQDIEYDISKKGLIVAFAQSNGGADMNYEGTIKEVRYMKINKINTPMYDCIYADQQAGMMTLMQDMFRIDAKDFLGDLKCMLFKKCPKVCVQPMRDVVLTGDVMDYDTSGGDGIVPVDFKPVEMKTIKHANQGKGHGKGNGKN